MVHIVTIALKCCRTVGNLNVNHAKARENMLVSTESSWEARTSPACKTDMDLPGGRSFLFNGYLTLC